MVTVVKEMGLTPESFVRTLPNAVGERHITQRGLTFLIENPALPDQRVSIELTEQAPRRIASITLPVTLVALHFDGFEPLAQEQFLTRFDLYFHKGGG